MNPLKRKRTDLSPEEPELKEDQVKRRRTETGEKDGKTVKTQTCVETSCSFPRGEREENPLERKSTDDGPKLQPSETAEKRKGTEKEITCERQKTVTRHIQA